MLADEQQFSRVLKQPSNAVREDEERCTTQGNWILLTSASLSTTLLHADYMPRSPLPLFSHESYSSDWSYSYIMPLSAGPGCGLP